MSEAAELAFLESLVLTLKPEVVAAAGVSAKALRVVEEAMRANGVGRLVEPDGRTRRIDLFLCAAGQEQRLRESLGALSPHGVILLHDPGAARALAREGLVSVVELAAGEPLLLAQKRPARA